jgi:hypothetical protein
MRRSIVGPGLRVGEMCNGALLFARWRSDGVEVYKGKDVEEEGRGLA